MNRNELDRAIDARLEDETWAPRMTREVMARESLTRPKALRPWLAAAAALAIAAFAGYFSLTGNSAGEGSEIARPHAPVSDSVYGTTLTASDDDPDLDDLLRTAAFSE